MITEYDELYKFCEKLFGKNNVSRQDYHDPEAIEIEVKIANAPDKIEKVSLNLNRGEPMQSFMHIGSDFTFEFDDKETHGISEMKRYLTALAEKRLTVKRTKIFGFTIDKKLIILEPQ